MILNSYYLLFMIIPIINSLPSFWIILLPFSYRKHGFLSINRVIPVFPFLKTLRTVSFSYSRVSTVDAFFFWLKPHART